MSKVILTQKQADAVEELRKAHLEMLREFFNNPDNYHIDDNLKQLLTLTPDEYHHALYIGYEVEPEYSKGDWVVTKVTNHVGQITGYREISKDYEVDDDIMTDYLRHATPEEITEEKRRRWWHNRDREVWEVYEGDIIKAKEDGLAFNVASLNIDYLRELSIDELDERYLVICLDENREDTKDE